MRALGVASLSLPRVMAAAAAMMLLSAAAPAAAQCYKGRCDGLDTGARGANFGSIPLSSSARSVQIAERGISGGDVDASYLGSTPWGPCAGYATVLPDHIVEVGSTARELSVTVTAQQDTVLLIHGPGGWLCNDDAVGTDPSVRAVFEPGTYRVWVASYRPGHTDYALEITSARGPTTIPTIPTTPTRPPPPPQPVQQLDVGASRGDSDPVTLSAAGLREPVVVSGRATGTVDAGHLGNTETGPCAGQTDVAPDHILTLTDRFDDLELAVRSSADTTLIVHGPHGWLCADDNDGTNPVLRSAMPPGTYRVWVGAWRPSLRAEYSLQLADRAAPPPPPPIAAGFEVVGSFERTDVRFSGVSIDELVASCLAWTRSVRTDFIDDVVLNGRTMHNSSGFWDAGSVCAIAGLNATPLDPRLPQIVSGSIEGIPFALWESMEQARRVAQAHLPAALEGTWVDDVTIGAVSTHNDSGWWSVEQVVGMILSNFEDPLATWIARGTIEDVPFAFGGQSPDELARQCMRFWGEVLEDTWVDDLTVNGQSRHNNSGWWDASEACMIVSTLAGRR